MIMDFREASTNVTYIHILQLCSFQIELFDVIMDSREALTNMAYINLLFTLFISDRAIRCDHEFAGGVDKLDLRSH